MVHGNPHRIGQLALLVPKKGPRQAVVGHRGRGTISAEEQAGVLLNRTPQVNGRPMDGGFRSHKPGAIQLMTPHDHGQSEERGWGAKQGMLWDYPNPCCGPFRGQDLPCPEPYIPPSSAGQWQAPPLQSQPPPLPTLSAAGQTHRSPGRKLPSGSTTWDGASIVWPPPAERARADVRQGLEVSAEHSPVTTPRRATIGQATRRSESADPRGG